MKRKAWFLGALMLGGTQLASMVTVSCSGAEPIEGSGGSTGGTTHGSGGKRPTTGGNDGSGGLPDICPEPGQYECLGPCVFGCVDIGQSCECGGEGGAGGFGGVGGIGGLGGFGGDAP